MTVKYECDVCHGVAKKEDSRAIHLTDSVDGTTNAGFKENLHICSQRCKDRLVRCIKDFLDAPVDSHEEG